LKALRHLNKYLWKYKWYLILGALFTLISNIFGLIPAQLVRESLDLVLTQVKNYHHFNGTTEAKQAFYDGVALKVLYFGGLILLLALLKGFFLFLVRQSIIVMSRHIEYDLKNEIYAHYQTLPLSFYRKNNTGDLMARISEDVSKVRMYVGPSIMYGLNLIMVFVLVIGYMLSINTKLTAYVLLPLPLLSVSIFYVNKIIMRRSERLQKQLSSISTYVQEAFSGIRVIKAFVQEGPSVVAFEQQANNYRLKSVRLTKIDAMFTPLIQLLIGFSTILVVYIGGKEVMAGRITVGNITEFIMYVYILTWPVTALGWTSSQIQRAAASQERINEFLQIKNNISSSKNLKKVLQGEIKFEQVSLLYPETGIWALKNFSMTVQAGQSVAILGTTGSGKSSIANLLCRMYDSSQGTIQIDQHAIQDYQVQHLRSQIGYVPQDVFLFSDSIANNVRFGAEYISQKEIENASQLADLHNNVVDFEKGYETVLGERGITLSGGQKQRLSIARAIVRNPKILVLDDCLSAVDTETEHRILTHLEQVMAGRTTIIISHRVSSAKLANFIIMLDQGSIVESGSHEQLLAKNGMYKELYEKQMYESSSAVDID
jgi:ATP-binding cassette, subfamily B, multidrug efflux pump